MSSVGRIFLVQMVKQQKILPMRLLFKKMITIRLIEIEGITKSTNLYSIFFRSINHLLKIFRLRVSALTHLCNMVGNVDNCRGAKEITRS
jgi:hypothetical protein